jgi:hypothetical protein
MGIRTGVGDAVPADGDRGMARDGGSGIGFAHRGAWTIRVAAGSESGLELDFLYRHAIGLAALEVAVLWCVIGATTLVFSRVSTSAAWLMAPYWAWVTFASVLNATIWRLNPTAG